jgi:micrococcal nuclease
MNDADDAGPIPLPRRTAHSGSSEIGRARDRMYGVAGDAEGPSRGDVPARWGGVDARERSAALARSATSRLVPDARAGPPRSDEAPAPREPDEFDDVPEDADRAGAPEPVPAPIPVSGHRRSRFALLAAAAAALLAVGLVLGLVLAPAPPPVAAPPGPPGPPTMIGQVVAVLDGETVAVRLGDRTVDVAILGLDTPATAGPGRAPECGGPAAAAYASATLTGRLVTLVPDPSAGEFDAGGRRLAYVVLRTQQSYTDLALLGGLGRRSTAQLVWYDEVFVREEAAARAAGLGIWGPPCLASV